jgi:hypothetical protein
MPIRDGDRILPSDRVPPQQRYVNGNGGSGMPGMGDYAEALRYQIEPAEGAMKPYGPANAPITDKTPTTLADIKKQLEMQNNSSVPLIRGKVINDAGVTLDWSMIGQMDRITIRNRGSNSVWIAFDVGGPSVDAFTSDLSIEVQSQESWSFTNCAFFKIGCKCAAGQTSIVHAVAFQAIKGDLGATLS